MLNKLAMILSFVLLSITPTYAASPEHSNSIPASSNSLQLDLKELQRLYTIAESANSVKTLIDNNAPASASSLYSLEQPNSVPASSNSPSLNIKPLAQSNFQPTDTPLDPHRIQQPMKTNHPFLKELLPASYVILGFLLGLFGTLFAEHVQKRRRKHEFWDDISAELRQTLPVLLGQAFLLDHKMTVQKFQTNFALCREFDLPSETNPLGKDPLWDQCFQMELSKENLEPIVNLHNLQAQQKDTYSVLRKIHCRFIEQNISSIPLLKSSQSRLLFSALRKISAINDAISRLDFPYEKSFDPNLSHENSERMKVNLKINYQFISDLSYKAANEIAALLRQ